MIASLARSPSLVTSSLSMRSFRALKIQITQASQGLGAQRSIAGVQIQEALVALHGLLAVDVLRRIGADFDRLLTFEILDGGRLASCGAARCSEQRQAEQPACERAAASRVHLRLAAWRPDPTRGRRWRPARSAPESDKSRFARFWPPQLAYGEHLQIAILLLRGAASLSRSLSMRSRIAATLAESAAVGRHAYRAPDAPAPTASASL